MLVEAVREIMWSVAKKFQDAATRMENCEVPKFLHQYCDEWCHGEGKQAPSSRQTSEKTTYLNAHLARGGIAQCLMTRTSRNLSIFILHH